jgi:hypothetical protein
MGNYVIHHPLVQFYLLYVGVLVAAVIWDHMHKPTSEDVGGSSPRC